MSLNSPIPVAVPGKSAVASKTMWSLVLAIVTYLLPTILAYFGIPPERQGDVINLISQGGPLLFPVLAMVFHSISKTPVTSVLPKDVPPSRLMGVVATFLVVGMVMGATLPLAACAGQTSLIPPTAEVQVAEGVTSLDDLYNKAAGVYLGQVATHPAWRTSVKPLLQKALPLIQVVDAAEKAGNATPATLAAQTAQAIALIQQAQTVLATK